MPASCGRRGAVPVRAAMKRLMLLIQLAIVCCAQMEDTSVDIDIEIDFNPCSVKKCGENEECRVVAHSELLQIPVAVCIETKKANEDRCVSFTVGSNILNCKTKSEWKEIGEEKCATENTDMLVLQAMKTQHVCHHGSDSDKYLSADFTCCPEATPPVLTTATPETTIPTGRSGEDTTSVGVNFEPTDIVREETENATDTTRGTTSMSDSTTDTTEGTTGTPEGTTGKTGITTDTTESTTGTPEGTTDTTGITTDTTGGTIDQAATGSTGTENIIVSEEPTEPEKVEDDHDDTTILLVVAISTITAIILFIGISLILRYKAQTKPRISKTPTVLVNTNCDDYKVVFETPSYPDDPMYKTYKNLY